MNTLSIPMTKEPTLFAEAQTAMELLRTVYTGNRLDFDFKCSQVLAGDHNKRMRQEIVRLVTGEKKPKTKCGLHAVADCLKIKFDQPELF